MSILITGCAGFIGFHTCKKILAENKKVIGIDNLNNYYDVKLKIKRLNILKKNKNFFFFKNNLSNINTLEKIIVSNNVKILIHLAAQAGVRDSISYPKKYFDNNVVSFFNLLELHRKFIFKSFIFASSSSVYGKAKKMVEENETLPIQFYAATKKNNEDFARIYSKIYNLGFVGLRFFTVYGSFGRPDMSYFKFSNLLFNKKKIEIYNFGNHMRDFTHIDDVVNCIILSMNWTKKNQKKYEVFNVGNGKKIPIMQMIKILEQNFKKNFKIKFINKQIGDMKSTQSDLKKSKRLLNYNPKISIKEGLKEFCDWYKDFYKFK